MKVKQTGTVYEYDIEGPIGESSPIFEQKLKDATQIIINMEKVTYISSIGVKTWISWTHTLPYKSQLILRKVPLVIANQASMVMGFMPPTGIIESFFAPFVCPDCDTETPLLLTMGKEYDKTVKVEEGPVVNLPVPKCPKCGTEMEPDFTPSKTFGFLNSTGKAP